MIKSSLETVRTVRQGGNIKQQFIKIVNPTANEGSRSKLQTDDPRIFFLSRNASLKRVKSSQVRAVNSTVVGKVHSENY